MCILYLSFITTKIRYFLWNENKNERYASFSIDKMLQSYPENLFSTP